MGKITFVFLSLIYCSSITAQNTFPSTGNVGIGTINPSALLNIEASSSSNPQLHITSSSDNSKVRVGLGNSGGYLGAYNPNGNETVLIRSYASGGTQAFFTAGNIGIGTTSPSALLNIEASSSSDPQLHITSSSDNSKVRVGLGNSGGYIGAYNPDGDETVLIRSYASGGTQAFFTAGNVGIGTTNPQSKLAVEGQIRATEVKVLADISVPDYVFEPDYELRTLHETKEYITVNKHLPEIPSAAEIDENGIDLGDMNMRLLKKIEELTLYQIQLMEEMEAIKKELQELKK